MSKNKININPENITEWLCSTGHLFPRNHTELSRLERLYPEVNREVNDKIVDPIAITNGTRKPKAFKIEFANEEQEQSSDFRMAARKPEGLPDHILDKMKRNQENSNGNDTYSE